MRISEMRKVLLFSLLFTCTVSLCGCAKRQNAYNNQKMVEKAADKEVEEILYELDG